MSASDTVRAELKVLAGPVDVARAAAVLFVEHARAAIDQRHRFNVALSGGSTPRALYALLGGDPAFQGAVDWSAVHLYWGDERHVPADHIDSNYRMARETLLDKAPIPEGNVHRIAGETADAAEAARRYQAELERSFGMGAGGMPVFDLVLLGLGTDAHTASLFPETEALKECERLVVANWVPQARAFRITLTAPVLNAGRAVVFLVSGADKASAVAQVLQGEHDPQRWPAQLVAPYPGQVVWLLDRAAAGALTGAASSSCDRSRPTPQD